DQSSTLAVAAGSLQAWLVSSPPSDSLVYASAPRRPRNESSSCSKRIPIPARFSPQRFELLVATHAQWVMRSDPQQPLGRDRLEGDVAPRSELRKREASA